MRKSLNRTEAENINYRALNKRRLDLRGAVSVKIKVSGENCQEVISDAFGMNVKVKKTPVKLAQKKISSVKSVQLSEEIKINDSQPNAKKRLYPEKLWLRAKLL